MQIAFYTTGQVIISFDLLILDKRCGNQTARGNILVYLQTCGFLQSKYERKKFQDILVLNFLLFSLRHNNICFVSCLVQRTSLWILELENCLPRRRHIQMKVWQKILGMFWIIWTKEGNFLKNKCLSLYIWTMTIVSLSA